MAKGRLADAIDDQRRALRTLREDVATERARLAEEREAVTMLMGERWELTDTLRDLRGRVASALRTLADDLETRG